MALWVGLDPADGTDDERALEHRLLHLLEDLGPVLPADLVATHWAGEGGSRHAVATLRLPAAGVRAVVAEALAAAWDGAVVLDGEDGGLELGPRGGREAAREAVAQARSRQAGRLVRFPGQDALDGPRPVADVPLVSAVEVVVPVVGALEPDAVLDPRGYVRPRWEGGRVVLPVRPGGPGVVVPVERESVHSCAGH